MNFRAINAPPPSATFIFFVIFVLALPQLLPHLIWTAALCYFIPLFLSLVYNFSSRWLGGHLRTVSAVTTSSTEPVTRAELRAWLLRNTFVPLPAADASIEDHLELYKKHHQRIASGGRAQVPSAVGPSDSGGTFVHATGEICTEPFARKPERSMLQMCGCLVFGRAFGAALPACFAPLGHLRAYFESGGASTKLLLLLEPEWILEALGSVFGVWLVGALPLSPFEHIASFNLSLRFALVAAACCESQALTRVQTWSTTHTHTLLPSTSTPIHTRTHTIGPYYSNTRAC